MVTAMVTIGYLQPPRLTAAILTVPLQAMSHLQACQCLPFPSVALFCKRDIHNSEVLTSEPNPASIQDIQEKRLS